MECCLLLALSDHCVVVGEKVVIGGGCVHVYTCTQSVYIGSYTTVSTTIVLLTCGTFLSHNTVYIILHHATYIHAS